MNWEIALAEAIGGRPEQQDRSAAFAAADGSECLLVVADGMGGHRGGALAAQAVMDVAATAWRDAARPIADPEPFLIALCRAAHDAINRVGQRHNLAPGSTIVCLHLGEARATWCHVGDSRLYLFRNGQPVRRSRDHSLVQLLVDLGHVQEEDMAHHPDQNKLLSSLGVHAEMNPASDREALTGGEAFVLCTDGLWETVTAEEMAAALAGPDLDHAVVELVGTAEERGGVRGDNVSAILARRKPGAISSP